MLSKQLTWGCGKAVLSVFLLVPSTYSFSMVNDKKDDALLPEWRVQSCLKNMPPFLRGIYNSLKFSGTNGDMVLLVGPPGTSKSTTATAIAQSLRYKKYVLEALDLFRDDPKAVNKSIFSNRSKKNSEKNTMLIIKGLHKLFANHTKRHTDYVENIKKFLKSFDSNRPIFTMFTANCTYKLPQEITNQFRGKWVSMPPLNSDQLYDAFNNIATQQSISVNDVAKSNVKSFLEGKNYSFRDVQSLINSAKIFASAQQSSVKSCPVLTEEHVKKAFAMFNDPENIMNFGVQSINDKERRHQENLDFLNQLFVQKLQASLALRLNNATQSYKLGNNGNTTPKVTQNWSNMSKDGINNVLAVLSPDQQKYLFANGSQENQEKVRVVEQVKKELLVDEKQVKDMCLKTTPLESFYALSNPYCHTSVINKK